MRAPRAQFTIRRLMLAVAVFAVALGGCRIVWLRHRYRTAAATHSSSESFWRKQQSIMEQAGKDDETHWLALLETAENGSVAVTNLIGTPVKIMSDLGTVKERNAAEFSKCQQQVEYHAVLKRKYQRAAARPWYPVDPDPPPPISKR